MSKKLIVIMGVSGCGKSTIGGLLAQKMHVPFLEGDDFHPIENKRKMSSGVPLCDSDRVEWINALTREIKANEEQCIVLACSALTPFVQNSLQDNSGRSVIYCWLSADYRTLLNRMKTRAHFMPPDLLESQLEDLSVPSTAKEFSTVQPIEVIVSHISNWLVSGG